MKKTVFKTLLLGLSLAAALPAAAVGPEINPVGIIKTSQGDIRLELFAAQAPETVKNFIDLAEGRKTYTDSKTQKKVKTPFYDNLIFHRVIKNFMIQGGCPLGNGTGGPGYTFADEINAVDLGLDKIRAVQPDGRVRRIAQSRPPGVPEGRAAIQPRLCRRALARSGLSGSRPIPRPEDRRSHPHMGGAEANCGLEIGAHPHG